MLRRTFKYLVYCVVTITILVSMVLVFFDWNWLRHPVEQLVTKSTGRTLIIKGNIHVQLGWPLARIQASEISFFNPTWSSQPVMLTLKHLDGSINLRLLIQHQVSLPTLRLESPRVCLEQSADGRKNWLLDPQQHDENAQVKIGHLFLDNGQISYLDVLHRTNIQAQLHTRGTSSAQTATDIVFSAAGQWVGLPLIASGSGGPALALDNDAAPYPLSLDLNVAHTHLHARGTVTSLSHLSAVNVNMSLSGPSLDQLYPLIGIALPRTPAYTTTGHLMHNAQQWHYEKFVGRIGKSDVAGDLLVSQGKQRPFLSGDLTFQRLNLADLGALVGQSNSDAGVDAHAMSATSNTKLVNHATHVLGKVQAHTVLPKLPFRTRRWNGVDADVTLRAQNIQRAKSLPITTLMTRIQMRDSILTLNPLSFGVAGGSLAGQIVLNGQNEPIHAQAFIHARHLLLNKLFPTIMLTHTSVGQMNGDFNLSADGDAIDQMLASANGNVVLVVDNGKISKLMLEAIGLHLWEVLELELLGDKLVQLNCAVANFDVLHGVLQTKAMVVDTQVSTIVGNGNINMATETLDLNLQPYTKITSPLALRSPIYIRGTFAKPEVSFDKTKLVVRSVGAVILGTVNPFLAIIPLIDAGPGRKSQCGKLITEHRQNR